MKVKASKAGFDMKYPDINMLSTIIINITTIKTMTHYLRKNLPTREQSILYVSHTYIIFSLTHTDTHTHTNYHFLIPINHKQLFSPEQ